jgi:tripartite-type tricarboxylate transporter receptor subunit TctC
MKLFKSARSAALLACSLLGPLGMMSSSAQAQTPYPTKPVRIVVGFSAGGSTDVLARILAKDMTEDLGQSFVVENKPGARSPRRLYPIHDGCHQRDQSNAVLEFEI